MVVRQPRVMVAAEGQPAPPVLELLGATALLTVWVVAAAMAGVLLDRRGRQLLAVLAAITLELLGQGPAQLLAQLALMVLSAVVAAEDLLGTRQAVLGAPELSGMLRTGAAVEVVVRAEPGLREVLAVRMAVVRALVVGQLVALA